MPPEPPGEDEHGATMIEYAALVVLLVKVHRLDWRRISLIAAAPLLVHVILVALASIPMGTHMFTDGPTRLWLGLLGGCVAGGLLLLVMRMIAHMITRNHGGSTRMTETSWERGWRW